MSLNACNTTLNEIQAFRTLFLRENNFQIRYNACHERNWSDSWLLTVDDVAVGSGSVKGKEDLKDRDSIFEFFVLPPFRNVSNSLFESLLSACHATCIECQSNDLILTQMLFEYAENIHADVVLFHDHRVTEHKLPQVSFRLKKENDIVFEHTLEPEGEYVLEKQGEVIATGGFMLHYNIPFADLYMEVKENYRKKGCGAFILQELKRACYLSGRVPAARCDFENVASRATLLKAGMQVTGFILAGDIKTKAR